MKAHPADLNNGEEAKGCLSDRSSRTTIEYANPDDEGRATGAWACLSPTIRKINFTDPQTPVGFEEGMNRSHLIAREFGGNRERINIAPTSVEANQDRNTGMRGVEQDIEGRLRRNERVFYSSIPVYGLLSLRPVAVKMYVASASGTRTETNPSGVYP